MAGVEHWFECLAHGEFVARVKAGTVPKCPKGCGSSMVKLIFKEPPKIGKVKYKRCDKLLGEAAELQGLSDISTSPSRPGGSVMQRLRMRHGQNFHPTQLCQTVDGPMATATLQSMTHRTNGLNNQDMRNFTHEAFGREAVMGHQYDKSQWRTDEKTGKVRHEEVTHTDFLPKASVETVKGDKKLYNELMGKP